MHLPATTSADLELILKWVPSETAMMLWSGPTFSWPLTRHQLERYLQNGQRQYWIGLHPTSGKPVGHASLLIDNQTRTMRLGFILLDPAIRGRGLGRELIETAVRAGFEATDLPVMTLGVYAHNPSARHTYENLGFRETGRVRRTEVDGRPWHALEMKLPRHDPADRPPRSRSSEHGLGVVGHASYPDHGNVGNREVNGAR